jgi:hypothetical protein
MLPPGAFGYTGHFLSARLLAAGRQVRTLTDYPRSDPPLSGRIEVHPFVFHDHDALVKSRPGATTRSAPRERHQLRQGALRWQ